MKHRWKKCSWHLVRTSTIFLFFGAVVTADWDLFIVRFLRWSTQKWVTMLVRTYCNVISTALSEGIRTFFSSSSSEKSFIFDAYIDEAIDDSCILLFYLGLFQVLLLRVGSRFMSGFALTWCNTAKLCLLDEREDHDLISFNLSLNAFIFIHTHNALNVVNLHKIAIFSLGLLPIWL